jgi:N-acetylmuramoyl-L-alanine amidase
MASAIFRAIKGYKEELELSSSNLVVTPISNEIKVDSTKLLPKKDTTQKGVIFKVQIKTSLEEKEIASIMNFKVDVFKEKNMFKYTIGNEMQLEKAKEIQKIAIENGYKDAFVIAFLNNKKIGVSDAINFQKQQ